MSKMDIVLINPGNRKVVYQNLGDDLAAIEPPFWVGLTATYLRNKGFSVDIIDANAMNYSPEDTAQEVNRLDPSLAAVVVYGSQPSASTQNMGIAGKICEALQQNCSAKVALGGLHPSALPQRTLEEEATDYVIEGEGQYTYEKLLPLLSESEPDYSNVPGLWWKDAENKIHSTPKPPNCEDLDRDLPIVAWDLLPMEKYRAHNWHCFDHIDDRSPYAVLYTSLGCPYSCTFCCINAPFGKPGIRYRSPEKVVEEIDLLVEKYGVKNIKIVDELFILNEKHYMKIVDLLLERQHDLNFWCYGRVDTIDFKHLDKMKKAGINWICLGIESASELVRDGAQKKMRKRDITDVVKKIQDAGIRVISNFMFGLPDDDFETMQETFDLAQEINAEFFNIYSAMAYPGSNLYDWALENNHPLPSNWSDYSQHAYNQLPLPTKHISGLEVLKFRDEKWQEYYDNPEYLEMVEEKFGPKVLEHIKFMKSQPLKRNYGPR